MKKQFSVLRSLTSELPSMVSTLRRYVEQESPSASSEAISSLASLIASDFAALTPRIRQHKLRGSDSVQYGPALQINFPGPRRSPRLLLLGHIDTVYPLGTLRSMPFREHGAHVSGPGVFDMKAGVVQALFALKSLLAQGPTPCTVTILLVPDEEIGSPASRELTSRLALRSSAVLILEPAAGPRGACKTARKGVARYTLRIHGIAAHAGLDFESGASAIIEAANQIISIDALSKPFGGLTLNPGIISGGTRPNVVADFAEVIVDVRFRTASQASRIDSAIRKLKPRDSRCRIELTGGIQRPPFERTKKTQRLYRVATDVAQRLGFSLEEAAVGGASDGNLTSALGIPTLDGLGAVGNGAHSPNEFVVAREMPRRAAFLAEFIRTLAAQ